tara:strand:- start:163 stop:570 length:408 start_codon:yes stop_codon:yes gene_type:complete
MKKMNDSQAFKCPSCGYSYFKKYNKSKEIQNLIKLRSKKTVKLIRKIAKLIVNNIDTENGSTYFLFLNGIKNIDDITVQWGIEQYYQSKHYAKGKGFAYLRSIIQNRNSNAESIRKNERRMLGSAPPVINHEKGE